MNICSQCGSQVPQGDRFCQNCGADLALLAPEPTVPPRRRRAISVKSVVGVAAVIGIAVAVGLIVWLAVGGGSAPIGEELARHTYDGQTYVLVQYGQELAVFSEAGDPVTSRRLAQEILHSYAWKQALADIDANQMAEIANKVEQVDSSIEVVRSASNAAVGIFDDLEGLGGNVPFVGRVSAMNVLRDAFPGLGTAQSSIRSLDSELTEFGRNAETLTTVSGRVAALDTSDIDGNDMDSLFRDAASAVQGLQATVQSVRSSVADTQRSASDLESALLDAADTPLIGGAIRGLASTAARFESELAGLTSLLGDFEGDLSALAGQFQASLDTVANALAADLERWLETPHDVQWPPTDLERRPTATTSEGVDSGKGRVQDGVPQQAATTAPGPVGAEPPVATAAPPVTTTPASQSDSSAGTSADAPMVVYNSNIQLISVTLYGPVEAPIDEDGDVFLLTGVEGIRIKGPVVIASEVPAIDFARPDLVVIEFVEEADKWLVTLMPLQFNIVLDDSEGEIVLHNVAFHREGQAVHSVFTFLASADHEGRVRIGIASFLDGSPAADGIVVPVEVRSNREETTIAPVPITTIPGPAAPPQPEEPPVQPIQYEVTIEPSAYDEDASHWSGNQPDYHDDPSMARGGATYSHAFGSGSGRMTYHFQLSEVVGAEAAIVSARLSSERGGYSAPAEYVSDVTLEVNDHRFDTKRVIADDGAGRVYTWRIDPRVLTEGVNSVSFVVDSGVQNGLAVYYVPFSNELERQYIRISVGPEGSFREASYIAEPVKEAVRATPEPEPPAPPPQPQAAKVLTVPWTASGGVWTANAYSGYVHLSITGTGRAAGNDLNDAFYVIDRLEESCEDTPFVMHVWTAGQSSPVPLASLIPDGCPAFNPDHKYEVVIDLTGYEGPLAFGTADGIISDNSGELSVALALLPADYYDLEPPTTDAPEPKPEPAPVVQTEGPFEDVMITSGRPPDMSGQLSYDVPACPRDVSPLWLREDSGIDNMVDLDVLYIERQPVYGYRQAKTFPDVGEYVTYAAHVANRGGVDTNASASPITVRWEMLSPAGEVLFEFIKSYQLSLPPNAIAEFKLGWRWQDGPNRLTFRVDPQDQISEWTLVNNSVEVFTNALLVGLAFEESFYDWMSAVMNGDIEDSFHDSIGWDVGRFNWFTRDPAIPPHRPQVFGAESWAQRQIEQMNEYIRKAEDDYFGGVRHSLPRVALQAVPVVADEGMTSDNAGLATDGSWGDLDLVWGFQATFPIDDCPTPGPQGAWVWLGYYKPQFRNAEDPLIHELGHHVALRHEREIYGEYEFAPGTSPITLSDGSPAIPLPHSFIGDKQEISGVMMNSDYSRGLSKYNAHTLAYRFQPIPSRDVPSRIGAINGGGGNWIPGGSGNYWDDYGTDNVWDWVEYEQPESVRLTVVDRRGNPVQGAEVELYGLAPPRRESFEETPTINSTTHAQGALVIDPTLLFPTGEGNPRTAVAVVRFGDEEFVRILSLADVNLDFWTGSTEAIPAMKLDGTRDGFPALLIGAAPFLPPRRPLPCP